MKICTSPATALLAVLKKNVSSLPNSHPSKLSLRKFTSVESKPFSYNFFSVSTVTPRNAILSSSVTTKLYSTTQINKFKMTSANMERGAGGRIEEAFAAAKDRGEAAFVSFVTAGYPGPEGEFVLVLDSR